MALLSFLDRELSVAHPGYSRWLVPPAALAIHLCIGQVYSFSVFKIPLSQDHDEPCSVGREPSHQAVGGIAGGIAGIA